MTGFEVQFLLGLLTGGVVYGAARLAGWIMGRGRTRPTAETFDIRTKSGKRVGSVTIPKNPTPEQKQIALEEIQRAGEKAQRLQHV